MNAIRYDYPDSMATLRLAQMLHKTGKYADAIKQYESFLEMNPKSTLAQNGMKGSLLAPEWRKTPTRYTVKRTDKFNSRRSEFSPMLYGSNFDQLYFASSRSKDKKRQK